jgi:hypothetical protein
MLVKSLVVSPEAGAVVPRGHVVVRGQAWSGGGEIVRVEVAVDGGEQWQEARLLGTPSPYAWRAWEFDWQTTEPGRHVLRSRATDASGQTQPAAARWNAYGYGSNGVRLVVFTVE